MPSSYAKVFRYFHTDGPNSVESGALVFTVHIFFECMVMVLHFYFVKTVDPIFTGTTKTYQFTRNLTDYLALDIYDRQL